MTFPALLSWRSPVLTALLTIGVAACGGREGASSHGGLEAGASRGSGDDATTDGSGSTSGSSGSPTTGSGGPDGGSETRGETGLADGSAGGLDGGDPGRVSIHLLNSVEYANTVHDLLGVVPPFLVPQVIASGPSAGFYQDFDNNADDLSVSPSSYAWYFQTAQAVASQAFATPEFLSRILTCSPQGPVDATCAEQIIRAFGPLVWRRPLTDAEVASLVQLASDVSVDAPFVALGASAPPDTTAGAKFAGAIEEVVVAMLSSESFLYRIEYDPDPGSTAVHPLSPYELASRLSYLLWSTMPDDELFAHAAAGDLGNDDVLAAELTRMLADPRSDQLVHNFAGQWLNFRGLGTLSMDTTVFPSWSSALGGAMEQEAFLFFSQFRDPTLKLTELMTNNVHFINGPLAQLYGVTKVDPAASTFQEFLNTIPERAGYLGFASFLTVTSWPNQTSPSSRGQWIMDQWLCDFMPNDTGGPPAAMTPPRQRLQPDEANPTCGTCHNRIDFLGFGLENFDALGEYRMQYSGGGAIDPSGAIPDGIAYSGEVDLADKLAQDPRAAECITRKALSYALGRSLGATDDSYVAALRDAWIAAGESLPSLLSGIARNDTFRLRRGEGP